MRLQKIKIAIDNNDGNLALWDTHTGEKLSTLREKGRQIVVYLTTETNRVLTMKFSPDGTRLATGYLDTSVQIWDTTTGEELLTLQKPIEGDRWSVSKGNGIDTVNNPMKNERLGRPSALAFSPDGALLACGSDDSTVKLWNTITGELVTTFTGHLSDIRRLTFSPEGNILASGSSDGTVRFWNINTMEALLTRITGHMWIRTASFLGDGSKLASAISNGIITVWDLQNSKKTTIQTKTTLQKPLFWGTYRHHVLSPDGTILANHGIQSDPSKSNYGSDVLRLNDVNTGGEVATFPDYAVTVFSPDGKILAGWGGNQIRLFNTEIGEGECEIIVAEKPGDDSDTHRPRINAIKFSPDGKKIVSGTEGGLVQIWEMETGIELSSFFEEKPPIDGSYQDPITTFAYSSDGSLLAVGTRKTIRILGSSTRHHFKEVSEDEYMYGDILTFSPDDKVLLRSLYDGKIELWDVVTGDKLTTLDGHSVFIEDLKFSPDNKTLMSVGGGYILFWDWDKVLASVHKKDTENVSEQFLPSEAESTENVLQFVENSSQKPKTSDHQLWKGEIYLTNEWFDVAREEFMKYLTAADFRIDQDVTTPPSFHRDLFARIGKIGKDVQDKEGFANMLNEIIAYFTDSLSIQLNAHLVLAKFYHNNDMLEKGNEHIQIIDSLTADLSTKGLSLQLNAYLSMAYYYHDNGMLDKADAYIQKIYDIVEQEPNEQFSLRLQLDTHLSLATYYRDKGMFELVDEHIKKTGFVTENAWMVLAPFNNAGGIGYGTAYIPEDITEIDLNAKYDGVDGPLRWKKFTDAKLDGYIHLGEQHVDWQVCYTFATVTSPDEREVQFRFDSDDQGKIWLNGKEVFSHRKTFKSKVDTYTIPVTLRPGKNRILVKVCNEQGGWSFYFRITDQDGQPFDDLKINRQ